MALTRITKGVIKPNENYDTHNINSTGIVTTIGLDVNGNADISGSLSVGGVLTYEDVTSIDSVGIITARTGLVSPYADIDDFVSVGSNIHLGNAGVITATSFVGSGAALTGIDATAIKDSGGNVKVQAQASGAVYTGIHTFNSDLDVDGHTNLDNVSIAGVVTATTFVGNGDFVELDVDGHTNLDNVSIAGVSTFSKNINLPDSSDATDGRIKFGATQDMMLFHYGGANYIDVTTNLNIRGSSSGNTISIKPKSAEEGIKIIPDGAVELYYNNIKMLETNIPSGHNGEVILGQKVHVRHTASGNGQIFPASGNLYLNAKNAETSIMLAADAGVHLFYNNAQKFVTTNTGAVVTGIVTATTFSGSGASLTNLNASAIASGTVPTARLGSGTANNTTFLRGDSTFQTVVTDLVNDTSPQLGGNLDTNTKNINFGDSSGSSDDRLNFGDSTDFSIYHSGSHNIINSQTAGQTLYLQSNNEIRLTATTTRIMDENNSEICAKFIPDGGVELYYDNYKNFEVIGDGAAFDNDTSNMTIYLKANNDLKGYIFATAGDEIGFKTASNEWAVRIDSDAEVDLYYDGSSKLTTASDGVLVSGSIYNSTSVNSTGDKGIGMGNGHRLGFDQSGTRSWTIKAASGNLQFNSGDGAGTYYFYSDVTSSGNIDSASDIKLKTNIKTIDNALDKVLQLRGAEYDRIDKDNQHEIGVIAQEVEKIIPEVVHGDETKTVSYGNMVAVLIEAIKEQNEVINKMKKEIEDLKG